MPRKNVIALTGSGISAESGLKTFRDAGGLWEGHRVEDVATPEAWHRNQDLVLTFYNERRLALKGARPNSGHTALAELEREHDVTIITQNVDDLHERAGSSAIVHLHGELTKARSSRNPDYVVDIGYREIRKGDRCPDGGQLRPHIVWFGEAVPEIERAQQLMETADVVLIIGTSLQVYPAAGLVDWAPPHAEIYLIDPVIPPIASHRTVHAMQDRASVGVPKAVARIIKQAGS